MAGSGWVWLVAAVILAAAEVVLPGYVLLGCAIGAGLVGLVLIVGGPLALAMAGAPALLALVFALLSLAAWIGLRRWAGGRASEPTRIDYDVNDTLPKD